MKWKPFTKRLLSLLLAAVMLAGTIPAASLTAYAEETSQQPDAQSDVQYTYTLNFDGNGDGVTGVPAPVTVTVTDPEYAIDIQPDQMNVTRPGYKFMGWCDNADGTGKTYKSGMVPVSFTKDNATKTVYAKWEADEVPPTTPSTPTAPTAPTLPPAPTEYTYSIVYHGNVDDNSVTNLPETETVTTGETSYGFKVSRVTPVRDGYDFTHWYKTPECTGQYQGLGWTLTATPDNPTIHLYAGWKVHVHQHTYAYTDNGDGTHSATCSDPTCGDVIDHEAHTYTSKVTKQPTLVETGERTYTCSKCGNSYTEEIPVVVPSAPTLKEISKLEQGQLVWIVDNYNVNADGKPGPAKYYPKQIDREESIHAPQSEDEYTLTAPVMEGDAYYCTLTIKASTIEKWIEEYKEYASNKGWEVDLVNSHSVNDFTYLLEYKYQNPWHVVKDSSGYTANDVYGKAIFMIHTKHNFHVRGPWVEDAEKGIATRRCDVGSTERSDVYRCNYTEVKPLSVDAAQILSDLSIRLSCQTNETDSKTVGLIPESLTAGEIVAGANSVYTCNVTLDCSKYLPEGHTLADGQSETISITLTWTPNAQRDNGSWSADTTEASIQVSCTSFQGPAAPSSDALSKLKRTAIYVVENYNVDGGAPQYVPKVVDRRGITKNPIPGTYELGEVYEKDGKFYCDLTFTDLSPYIEEFQMGYDDLDWVQDPKNTLETYAIVLVYNGSTVNYAQDGTGWIIDESASGSDFVPNFGKIVWMVHAKHTYSGTWTVTKPATCTETGVQTRTCTYKATASNTYRCKHVETEVIPATGHTWGEWEVTKAPTCTEAGEQTRTCSVCGETETETLEAAGHNWSDEWTFDETDHWHVCTVCGEKSDTAKHTWNGGTVTKPATPTEPGERTQTCNVCHATKTTETPVVKMPTNEQLETMSQFVNVVEFYKKGNPSSWPKVLDGARTGGRKLDSTCLLPGTYTVGDMYEEGGKYYFIVTINNFAPYAEAFNEKYADENVSYAIDTEYTFKGLNEQQFTCLMEYIGDEYPSNPVGWRLVKHIEQKSRVYMLHTHYTTGAWTVTKEATCTEDGERTAVCEHNYSTTSKTNLYKCKETFTETIPATGHDWDEGVVTREPAIGVPGEMTFTCKNDPTHTKVEEIPALVQETVMIMVYRNGNTEKPYTTASLDGYVKGDTLDISALNIADYYSSKNGFAFEGWYNDGGWNQYLAGNHSLTLGDTITINGWTNIYCMVTDYEKVVVKAVYDGDKDNAQTVYTGKALHGADLNAFLEENVTGLEKEGYTLDKWYNLDWYGHKIAENATVNGWTNVYITYTAKEYTVSFDANADGEVDDPAAQTVKYGSTASAPAISRTNWDFLGWYAEGAEEPFDFTTPITGDLTLTARWEKGTSHKPAASKQITSKQVDVMQIRAYAVGTEVVMSTKEMASCTPTCYAKGVSYTIGEVYGNDVDGYRQDVTFRFISGDTFEAKASSVFLTHGGLKNHPEWIGNTWVYDFDYEDFEAEQTLTFLWHEKQLPSGLWNRYWSIDDPKYHNNSNIKSATANFIHAYLYLERTVTYTDGVEGEELFADQIYTVRANTDTPAFEGTPSREGWIFQGWNPQVSEKVTADVTYVAQWKHDCAAAVQHIARVEPTCEEDGNIEYWYCANCGKYFTDEACTQEVSVEDTIIPATGHDWKSVGKIDATCTTPEYTLYQCGNDPHHIKQEVTGEALGHDYKKVVTEPTCTEGGYTTYTCTRCGETHVDDFTAPKGHSWDEGTIITAPGCAEDGVKEYTCTVCGEKKQENIGATGHTFVETKHEPNCTECGWITHTCSVCGFTYDSDHVAALGHDYEETVVAPTCTTAGYTQYTCKRCDHSYTDNIVQPTGHKYEVKVEEPTCTEMGKTWEVCSVCGDKRLIDVAPALGHDFSDEWTVDVEPTCEEEGSKSRHCSRCDARIDITAIPATGHDWDEGVVTKEPTCGEEGIRTFTCKNDPTHTYTEPIAKLDHVWNEEGIVTKEPTCEEPGEMTYTCVNDETHTKTEPISALGHDWDEGKVTKAPTCTEEGVKTFTCKNDPTHTRTEAIAAKGHTASDWKHNSGSHWQVCTECGEIIDGSKGSHVDKDSNGKCDVCGVKLTKTDSNGNPKTGDPAPIATIVTVLLISAAGICLILLLYYRKRSSRKDS